MKLYEKMLDISYIGSYRNADSDGMWTEISTDRRG